MNPGGPVSALLGVLIAIGLACLPGCEVKLPQRDGKVVGGSMAPAFLGEHCRVNCPDCSWWFAADFGQAESLKILICPNCGQAIPRESAETGTAENVIIRLDKDVERFDVVAFQWNELSVAGIKRIVGLENEQILINVGELIVDGQLLRKSYQQQKRLRIPVHDSSFQGEIERWQDTGTGWIQYCHRRCFLRPEDSAPAQNAESGAFCLEDHYGYNQSMGRRLNCVRDVFLEFEVEGEGEFQFRFVEGQQPATVVLNFVEGNGTFSAAGEVCSFGIRSEGLTRRQIEISNFDFQWLVAIDGNVVLRMPIPVVGQQPFTIGQMAYTSNQLEVHRVRIWRDIFYSGYLDRQADRDFFEPAPGFIVLGDNVPVSVDSRAWDQPRLERKNIIGRVQKKRN